MRKMLKFATVLVGAVTAASVAALPASAACTRLGFTVNDYGKDGPTKDAKELLDKSITKKMAERGISKYQTGKKDVKCELFLNFIVFDEHTCTAEATVCWDGAPLPKGEAIEASTGAEKSAVDKTPASKSKAKTDTDTAAKSDEAAKVKPAKASEKAAVKAPDKSEAKSEAKPDATSDAKSEAKAAEPAKAAEVAKAPEADKAAVAAKPAEAKEPKASKSAEKSDDGFPVPVKPEEAGVQPDAVKPAGQ